MTCAINFEGIPEPTEGGVGTIAFGRIPEDGEYHENLHPTIDAIEADEVRNEGAFVLIRSK